MNGLLCKSHSNLIKSSRSHHTGELWVEGQALSLQPNIQEQSGTRWLVFCSSLTFGSLGILQCYTQQCLALSRAISQDSQDLSKKKARRRTSTGRAVLLLSQSGEKQSRKLFWRSRFAVIAHQQGALY